MKTIFSLLMILMSSNIYSQWAELPSPTSSDLKCVFFTDSSNGFIVGDDGVALRTTNAGESWKSMIIPLDSTERSQSNFFKIKFINKSNGIFMGYSDAYNFLFKTNDGGFNWELVYLPEDFVIFDFDYIDENNMWLSASGYGLAASIYHSEDGGINWQLKEHPAEFPATEFSFLDSQLGVCVGTTTILFTDNGGNDWWEVDDEKFMQFNDIVFYTPSLIYSVVIDRDSYPNYESYFYKSTSGGYDWQLSDKEFEFLNSLYVINNSKIYICGNDGIYATYDGGLTWENQMLPDFDGFDSIYSLHVVNDYYYAVGRNGRIFKKVGELPNGINDDDQVSNNRFKLYNNYPNPFNPTTTIKFTIPKSGNVKLKVYDILGREVKTILDGFKQLGTYEINFNASELSSGIFYYQISTDNYSETRKMVIIK